MRLTSNPVRPISRLALGLALGSSLAVIAMACGRSELDEPPSFSEQWSTGGSASGAAGEHPRDLPPDAGPSAGGASTTPPDAGRCSASCDDQNACTRDTCSEASGCLHTDIATECAASNNPCKKPACDAKLGCTLVNVTDGTACGAADCISAQVCISGACVARAVPDGTTCAPATPCRAAGQCRNQICELKPKTAMSPVWSYRAEQDPDARFSSLAVDPEGNVYALSYAKKGKLISLTREGFVRFAVESGLEINALDPNSSSVISAGYPSVAEARSMTDGRLIWRVDLAKGTPVEHPYEGRGIFSVKLATVLGTSGVVAIVVEEGVSYHTSHIVGLSIKTGERLWSVRHPGHLYGRVADASGNLYLSRGGCWAPFDITFSVTSDGKERWSVTEHGIPIGTYADSLLMHHVGASHVVTPGTGNVRCDGTNFRSAVFNKTHVFGIAEDQTLYALDAQNCSDIWSTKPSLGHFSNPSLTSKGSLLIVDQGSRSEPSAASLRELSADGHEEFSCVLPGNPTSLTALDRGLWFAGIGDTLHAFATPGLELASSGWVTAAGNNALSGSPR